MMHRNNFVLAVKHNGKVLRESNGAIFLPFDSEYSLLLKNLWHNSKATAKVEIDGMNITNGQEFIIPPSSNIEIERFLLDGNLHTGKKFKFVHSSNPNVSDPSNKENGKIQITFWCEFHPNYYMESSTTWYTQQVKDRTQDSIPQPYWNTCSTNTYSTITSNMINCYANEQGATIEGNQSFQQFNSVSNFEKDPATETIITLTLKPTSQAITVDMTKRIYCPNCGVQNKWSNNYCCICGCRLNMYKNIY